MAISPVRAALSTLGDLSSSSRDGASALRASALPASWRGDVVTLSPAARDRAANAFGANRMAMPQVHGQAAVNEEIDATQEAIQDLDQDIQTLRAESRHDPDAAEEVEEKKVEKQLLQAELALLQSQSA